MPATPSKKANRETVGQPADKPALKVDQISAETPAPAAAVPTAKAGKRSQKAQQEQTALAAKAEQKSRHEAADHAATKPVAARKPARTRLERRGKQFRQSAAKVDAAKTYGLTDALELAVQTSHVKFDATVELHINLNINPRHADQNVRGNLVLPEGTGRVVRVAVFADDKIDAADVAGIETITKRLEKGEIDFDVLIAPPANMPKLGKYARLLGPRGLMPNPKSGTVTTDLAKAVAESKAGRVEYRVDSTGIVHLGIGKVSFGVTRLAKNAQTVLSSVHANKPASIKGSYVRSIYLTTTMGPSVKVENSAL